jgi:hypothetical protein
VEEGEARFAHRFLFCLNRFESFKIALFQACALLSFQRFESAGLLRRGDSRRNIERNSMRQGVSIILGIDAVPSYECGGAHVWAYLLREVSCGSIDEETNVLRLTYLMLDIVAKHERPCPIVENAGEVNHKGMEVDFSILQSIPRQSGSRIWRQRLENILDRSSERTHAASYAIGQVLSELRIPLIPLAVLNAFDLQAMKAIKHSQTLGLQLNKLCIGIGHSRDGR